MKGFFFFFDKHIFDMCVKFFDNAFSFSKNKCQRMLKVVGEPMN